MSGVRAPWFARLRERFEYHVGVGPSWVTKEEGLALVVIAEAAHGLVRAEGADTQARRLLETDEDFSKSAERQRIARGAADLAFANLQAALADEPK